MLPGVALSAVMALVYGARYADAPPSLARSGLKTGSVLVLALWAIAAQAPMSVVLALALSALGDWALSRAPALMFAAGVLAFCAAQVAYVLAFQPGLPDALMRLELGHLPGAGLLLFVGGLVAAALSDRSLAVRALVGLYAVLLMLMAAAAWSTGVPLIIAGAALFVVSDALIGWQMLDRGLPAGLRATLPLAIWASYWPAQALIATGAVLAL